MSGAFRPPFSGDLGESNTASNVGTAGVGIFKQKSGVDLQFKKLNAANNKITITDDAANDEVDIGIGTLLISDVSNLQTSLDVKQNLDSDLTAIAELSPNNNDLIQRKSGAWTNRSPAQFKVDLELTKADVGLSNVDNTSDINKPISIPTQTALDGKVNNTIQIATTHSIQGGGDLSTSRTLSLVGDTATPGNSKYYGTNSSGVRGFFDIPTGGSGEANTASNVGTAGVGIFKQKSGVDLQFKKLNAANNKITITDDAANDEVDIGIGTLLISDVSNLQTSLDAKQNLSAELAGISGLNTTGTLERTGSGTYATYTVTSAAKNILDDTTFEDIRNTLSVPINTIQIATQHSLQGGGNLTADRTLSLVGDTNNPGNNKLYGTNGSGVRGWYDQPITVRQTFSNTDVAVNSNTTLLAHTGNTLTGLRTITLPTGVSAGYSLWIVDETGLPAWWFPLRIVPPSGLINAGSHVDIQYPYQSALITYNGSNWFAFPSAPRLRIDAKNQFFTRQTNLITGTNVFPGNGLELASEISGTGYALNPRHSTSHLGGLSFNAGATSNTADRVYLSGGENLIFFGEGIDPYAGTTRFLSQIKNIRLNDVTNSLNYSIGFRDNVNTGGALNPTDAVYFSYGDTGNPVAENWTAITSSLSARTRVDTGVPVTSGDFQLGIEIDSYTAKFFIGHSLVANISSNIPRETNRFTSIRAGFNRLTGNAGLNDVLLVSEIKYVIL